MTARRRQILVLAILLVLSGSAIPLVRHWFSSPVSSPENVAAEDEAASLIALAAQDIFVHWFDDRQEDATSLFLRLDPPILPSTRACQWVETHREEAARHTAALVKSKVDLGTAILAAYLDLHASLPDLVEGWTKIGEEPYNGESAVTEPESLDSFREILGIAQAIEKLSGLPIAQAVKLTEVQEQRLLVRSENGDFAARAILSAVVEVSGSKGLQLFLMRDTEPPTDNLPLSVSALHIIFPDHLLLRQWVVR